MRISKTDPRLEAGGFYLHEDGPVAWLSGSDGHVCDVSIDGNYIVFFPERSSRQKKFLGMLGLTQ